jgi:ABC-type transporter Mla maintaining outer membrane lipid asymmetry ATPase subunit MlaF
MPGSPDMLFDEATCGLDPINDLVIRARDIHQISSLLVTKELHEIPYLETHSAVKHESGEITIEHIAISEDFPERESTVRMKVMALDKGRTVFFGLPAEFASSDLPQVTLMTHPPSSAPSTDTIPDPCTKKRPIKKEPS